jgi:hypothetical protein
MKPTTVSSEASAPITDDCFISIPCGPSTNANGIDIQNSTFTVPTSTQPTLIPQFSALSSSSSTASISAPLQLTQQVQTITIPSNCFPTDGTPLQIVLILPNSTNNNNNVSSPIIIQPQPLPASSSPPTNDAKGVEVKCEMKE